MPYGIGKGSPADIAWLHNEKLLRNGRLVALAKENRHGLFAIEDRELWTALERVYDAYKLRETRILKNFGLTPMQYKVLEFLSISSTITSLGELVEALHMSYGNLAAISKNLIKKGLIKSDYCDVDRRFKCVFVTAEGKETFTKAHEVYSKVMSNLFGGLSPIHKESLTKGLTHMLNHISGPEILRELE